MSTKKVSWADQIDDIPKMFESVELDEAKYTPKVPKKHDPSKDISVADYNKKTGKKTVSLKHLTKNTHVNPFTEESFDLDEAIDFRKAHQEIMAYAKKSGGIDKTDFEKVAYYVKAIGDNQNTPNVANKAFMAMKKFVGDMDTDPRDGVMLMLKKHGMFKNGRLVQESTEIEEASKEGTVRIIDLGNKGQDKIRKELGVDKLPNKGFQVQVMTKGKFVNQGKPYKTMKDAEKVRSTGQHSMQFDEAKAPALKSSDYPKGTSMSAQAFKDRFAKKKKAPALKSSDYPKGTSMSATAWKKKHESVEEATLEEKTKWKMGDGRPRNGPRIENDRFWNLPYDSLKYIAKDAGEAMKANPTARKATTGPGNWADQVADAATVMQWRKKNGIKESVELDEALKITHVVIDTADGNRIVSSATNEKQAKYSIVSAERPPMNIKDKKTLKVVQLKKPVSLNKDILGTVFKESAQHSMRFEEVKMIKEMVEEGLDARQIALLKKNYASIDRVDPNGPAYKKAKGMIAGLDKDTQMDLAKAKVKFLSQIAADELRKQHGVKLKASEYMESSYK